MVGKYRNKNIKIQEEVKEMLYPLRFEKVFIEKVWGGREFEKSLNMSLPEKVNIGESWEVSAHPNGMSIIENGPLKGRTLQEVYDEYKGKLTGEKVYKEYKEKFPLLIKYLDVNDRLSIQVHPDDKVALEKHNELGKSESWFIMEASDDATLIMGMKEGITREEFLRKAKKNDFTGLFEEIKVKKGDLIDITPGMVHASLSGSVLFAEIQENSDITYRIYDFDRVESNGKKRELHLDEAADVIDFNKKAVVINTDFSGKERRKTIIRKKYYSIDKVKIDEEMEDISKGSMIIYSILEGSGELIFKNEKGEDESLKIKKGESLLIPPHIPVTVKGTFEILRTIIE